MHNIDNSIISKNCAKWTVLPAGKSRIAVNDLLGLDDRALREIYESFKPFWDKERGWEHKRYASYFNGRNVLEIGSGLGYDAISLAKSTTKWTCADILDANLQVVKRIAKLHGILNISTQLMAEILEHDFKRIFNAFYAHGVLHHIPFELAQKQVAHISCFLEPGTRVVLLMYPRERWEHCGKPAFEDFGAMTDGPGTPWAEWYDDNKIKKLFGEEYELIETIPWGWKNIEFINFELIKKEG